MIQKHRNRTLFFAGCSLTLLFVLPLVTGCSPKPEAPKGAGGGVYYTGPLEKPGKKEPN
jgi:hypothetical protein